MQASSFGFICLVRGLLARVSLLCAFVITAAAWGQAPPKINVPYHCANGITYTVLVCKPYRADQWCQWKEEQNGNLVTTVNSTWSSMTGRLQGCTTGAPAAAAPTAPTGGPTDPAYLADMPSVDRVRAEIRGNDETDTLERQVAVLTYLGEYVKRIKYNKSARTPFTPDESRVMAAYSGAAYQIQQGYNKSHTPQEAAQFDHAQFNYMLNNGDEWARKLIGPQSAQTYTATLNQMNARQKAHVDDINRQNEEAKERAAAAAAKAGDPSGDNPNDPTVFASRRCAELGGSGLNCAGKGLMSGMLGLAGVDSDVMFASGVSGVVINGGYSSRTEGAGLTFTNTGVSVSGCGKLVADAHNYNIRKSGPAVQIVVSASPHQIVLVYHPDGSLTGPGPITLDGRIITGYTTSTQQLYVNGVPATCNGYAPCTTSTTTPIYAGATARCSVGSLAPPSPTAPETAPAPKQMSGLPGLISQASDNGELPTKGGLRMSGMYASSTGLVMNFENSDVILDCGRAHARQPYTVENGSSDFIVHVENSAGPFTVTVASDGSLRGSGHTTVNGKLFAGMNNGELTFRPSSAGCDVGSFSSKSGEEYKALISNMPAPRRSAAPGPTEASYSGGSPNGGAAGPALGSAVTPPAGSGARSAMHVVINSGFPAGHNPLANQVVSVRREPMPAVLRKLGVSIPANASSGEATRTLFSSCKSIDCRTIVANLKSYDVGNLRLDGNGSYTVNVNETTGPYFFFSMVRLPDGSFSVWDVPANLHPGENVVTFQPEKAENFKIDVNAGR